MCENKTDLYGEIIYKLLGTMRYLGCGDCPFIPDCKVRFSIPKDAEKCFDLWELKTKERMGKR